MAFDLVFAGTFLIQGRVVFLVLAATMTIVLHSIMLREERFLGKTYGEAFQQYCRDVGRYLSWRGKNGRRT